MVALRLCSFFSIPFLLEVGPVINPADESEGWSTVNFSSGIWDGAPAEIEFGAF